MLNRIRRSLALKLVLASALPSAAVLLVGLTALIEHSQQLEKVDPALAFAELRHGTLLGSLLALLFAAIAIGLATARFLVRPIKSLEKVMRRAEAGEFLVRAKVHSDDELGRLSRSFNTMLAKVTDMAVAEIETQQSVEQMEREVRLREELEAANRQLAFNLRELELLVQVSAAVSSTLDLTSQLDQLGRHVRDGLEVAECSLLLLDEAAGELMVEAVVSDQPRVLRGTRFRLGEGITGSVAAANSTIYAPDVEADPRFLQSKGASHVSGSFVGVPLKANGRLVGVMNLYRVKTSAFLPRELRLAEAIGAQAGLAIANARLYAQTLEQSITDPLTGLPNRRALFVRLEQEWSRSLRFGDQLSVLMIDLDHFKAINDTHGHLIGDVVLRGVALVLGRNVRQVDAVARYGGEEFCVVLPRVGKAEATEVAEKLRRAVAATSIVVVPGQPAVHVTLSVGVASHQPGDPADVGHLLQRADAALFEAKRAGRDRVAESAAEKRAVG